MVSLREVSLSTIPTLRMYLELRMAQLVEVFLKASVVMKKERVPSFWELPAEAQPIFDSL